MHETQQHQRNSFLTLTLSEETLASRREAWGPRSPIPPLSEKAARLRRHILKRQRTHENAHAQADTLSKRDVQLFLKRLRKDQTLRGLATIKFYACGEYGEKFDRPHYHIALFGEDFSDDRYEWRKAPSGKQLYRSPRLEKLWTLGTTEIGALEFESAQYVAGYITKKITGPKAETHYLREAPDGQRVWILPEFSLMSRGGRHGHGLAKEWLDKYQGDVYPHDYVIMQGKKLKPPRYYDKKYEEKDKIGAALMKLERELSARSQEADNTPQRLATKEKVATAKMNQRKRSI
jgi:hypothetical protein